MSKGSLYLVPNIIGDYTSDEFCPAQQLAPTVLDRVRILRHFIAESNKSGYAFLSRILNQETLSALSLEILDEHTKEEALLSLLKPLEEGLDVGLLSDAGMPCIADPGAALVALAQSHGVRVIPLPGPSSLLLALAASGLDGQKFSFLGYLPREESARKKLLTSLGSKVLAGEGTKLFIETPYRNATLYLDCLFTLPPAVHLCVAESLSTTTETIRSASVADHKKDPIPPGRAPAVFIIGLPATCKPVNTGYSSPRTSEAKRSGSRTRMFPDGSRHRKS